MRRSATLIAEPLGFCWQRPLGSASGETASTRVVSSLAPPGSSPSWVAEEFSTGGRLYLGGQEAAESACTERNFGGYDVVVDCRENDRLGRHHVFHERFEPRGRGRLGYWVEIWYVPATLLTKSWPTKRLIQRHYRKIWEARLRLRAPFPPCGGLVQIPRCVRTYVGGFHSQRCSIATGLSQGRTPLAAGDLRPSLATNGPARIRNTFPR